MSVIQSAIVKMHDNVNFPLPFQLFENEEYQFGNFEIQMESELPIINKSIYFIINIDVSGSMADKCIDGRLKIDHIKFTLENMLRLFCKYNATLRCFNKNISIYVQSFDTVVKEIIDTTNIDNFNVDKIIESLKKLYPENLTNIELALQKTIEKIENYNSNGEIVHIFLTDGDITAGSHDNNYLYSLVSKKCKNVFIGYGINHNSTLLNCLSQNKGDQYRFIDALEKASLVYGEVIHDILYRALEDVIVSTDEETEMYNYLTNTWVKKLELGDLSREQVKTIHLRTKNKNIKPHLFISGKTCDGNIIVYDSDSVEETCVTDISVYMFRQKTQELLYEARKVSENYNPIKYDCPIPIYNRNPNQDPNNKEIIDMKNKLKEFHKLMIDYVKTNNIHNSILEMCCDDIYIAYKTIGTHIGNMYTCARQTSNGREQSYVCSEIPNEIISQHNYDIANDLLNIIENEDYGEDGEEDEEEDGEPYKAGEDDIDNYQMSQNYLSPYTTNGMRTVMREVSYRLGVKRLL
jgi:uncharacterized protein YegL